MLFGTAIYFEGSSYLSPPSAAPDPWAERLLVSLLSAYERTCLQKRLTQIEHDPTAAIDRLRVLIVDDLADDTAMLSAYLRRVAPDCEVETCNEPGECVDIAVRFEPHLILLDLAMPSMTGYEVAQRLRKLTLPPFVLVARTGFADLATRDQCLANGFNYVLPKPGLDQLLRMIAVARKFAEL